MTVNEKIQSILQKEKAAFSQMVADPDGYARKVTATADENLSAARARRDKARAEFSANLDADLRELETERAKVSAAIKSAAGESRDKDEAVLKAIERRIVDERTRFVSEVDESVAETRAELRFLTAVDEIASEPAKRKVEKDIEVVKGRLNTLDQRAKALRDSGAENFRLAKQAYDETLATFVDTPGAMII